MHDHNQNGFSPQRDFPIADKKHNTVLEMLELLANGTCVFSSFDVSKLD